MLMEPSRVMYCTTQRWVVLPQKSAHSIYYRKVYSSLCTPCLSFHTNCNLRNVAKWQNELLTEVDRYIPFTFTSLAQIARRLPESVLSELSKIECDDVDDLKHTSAYNDDTTINNNNNNNNKNYNCNNGSNDKIIENTSDCCCKSNNDNVSNKVNAEQKHESVNMTETITINDHQSRGRGGLCAFLTSQSNMYEVTHIGKVTVVRKRSQRDVWPREDKNKLHKITYTSVPTRSSISTNGEPSSTSICNTFINKSELVDNTNTDLELLYKTFPSFTIPVHALWEEHSKNKQKKSAIKLEKGVNETSQSTIKKELSKVPTNIVEHVTEISNTDDSICQEKSSKEEVIKLLHKFSKWLDYRNPYSNKEDYSLEKYIDFGYVRIKSRYHRTNNTNKLFTIDAIKENGRNDEGHHNSEAKKCDDCSSCVNENENCKNDDAVVAVVENNVNSTTSNKINHSSGKCTITPDIQYAKYQVAEYEIYRLARLIPRLFVDVPLTADRMAAARNLLPPGRDPVHVFMSAPELYRISINMSAMCSHIQRRQAVNTTHAVIHNTNQQENLVTESCTKIVKTKQLSIIESLVKEHQLHCEEVEEASDTTNSEESNSKNNNKNDDDNKNSITAMTLANAPSTTPIHSTNENVTLTERVINNLEVHQTYRCLPEHNDLFYVRFYLERRFVPRPELPRATLQRELDHMLTQSRNRKGVTFPVDRNKRRRVERGIQFIDNPSPFFDNRVMAQYLFDLLPLNASVRFSQLMHHVPQEVKWCIPPEGIQVLKSFPHLFHFESTTSDQIICRADCEHVQRAKCNTECTIKEPESFATTSSVEISNDDVLMHVFNHYTSLRHPELGTNIFRYFALMPKMFQHHLLRMHNVETDLLKRCPDKIEIITNKIRIVHSSTEAAEYELHSNVATEGQLRSCKGRRDFFVAFRFKGDWQRRLIRRFQHHCIKYGYDPFKTQIITKTD